MSREGGCVMTEEGGSETKKPYVPPGFHDFISRSGNSDRLSEDAHFLPSSSRSETFFSVYTGSSMYPTLIEPEMLEFVHLEKGLPRPGDVIIFTSPEIGKTIVHRVVRVTADGVVTRGDNNLSSDESLVPPECIKGKVLAAWRGRRRRPIAGGRRGRLLIYVFRYCRPAFRMLSKWLNRPYFLLARLNLIGKMTPKSLRPRVIGFQDSRQRRLMIVMGKRIVGYYDFKESRWRIKKPFHLFINEKTLNLKYTSHLKMGGSIIGMR